MENVVTPFFKHMSGMTSIEYDFIPALIALACIGVMTFAGMELNRVYASIGTSLTGPGGWRWWRRLHEGGVGIPL